LKGVKADCLAVTFSLFWLAPAAAKEQLVYFGSYTDAMASTFPDSTSRRER